MTAVLAIKLRLIGSSWFPAATWVGVRRISWRPLRVTSLRGQKCVGRCRETNFTCIEYVTEMQCLKIT